MRFAGVEDGEFFLRWPADFSLGQEVSDQLGIYWKPAPLWRVAILFGGLALILLWNALARLLGAGTVVADGLLLAERSRGRRRLRPRVGPDPAHRRFGPPRVQRV